MVVAIVVEFVEIIAVETIFIVPETAFHSSTTFGEADGMVGHILLAVTVLLYLLKITWLVALIVYVAGAPGRV